MSDEELRPMHVTYDCTAGTGEAIHVSDEEWDAIKKGEQDAAAAAEEQAKKEEDLKNQILQRNDPVLTEVAKRAGIL